MSDSLGDVDILIKTFLRPNCLRRLVDSILTCYPDAHLNIADDSPADENMRSYYAGLETNGHTILLLPFDVGTTAGRNRLVDATNRRYLLVLDDDFVFTKQTRIETLLEVLEADRSLGVAAGALLDEGTKLRSYEFMMRREGGLVHFSPISRDARMIAGHPCYDADIVLNFALIRRDLLSTTRWDDSLKSADHEDFFLQLATTPWKSVYVPSVVADHFSESTATYMRYRMNRKNDDRFHRKWKTGGFVFREPDDPGTDQRRLRRASAKAALGSLRRREIHTAGAVIASATLAELRRLKREPDRGNAEAVAGPNRR